MSVRRVHFAVLFAAGVSFAVNGCSSAVDRYKSEIKNGLKALNELYSAYSKVQRKDQAEAAGKAIREAAHKAEEAKARIDAAEPASEKDKEKVLRMFGPVLDTILKNIKDKRGSASREALPEDAAAASDAACQLFQELVRKDEPNPAQKGG